MKFVLLALCLVSALFSLASAGKLIHLLLSADNINVFKLIELLMTAIILQNAGGRDVSQLNIAITALLQHTPQIITIAPANFLMYIAAVLKLSLLYSMTVRFYNHFAK